MLESPATHYSLKLNQLLTPQTETQGLFAKVRIDGGPVLRMLLDSGASYIMLDRHTGTLLGRTAGSPLDLVGVGVDSRTARQVAPGTVQIGDLLLSGCEMAVVSGHIMDGVDGVIPLSLFSAFLVRLDVPHRTLELDPLPDKATAQDDSYSPVRTENSMLFLQTTLNSSQTGYVLLDTGSSFNAVSWAALGAHRDFGFEYPNVPLLAGTGETEGFRLPHGVRFRFGSRVLSADPAIVVDLSKLSGRHRLPIAGLLGYPALRTSVVTVNYRDGLVRLAGK